MSPALALHFIALMFLPSLCQSLASSSRVRLITNKMCPFAQRSWIALEESGLEYSLEEVSLYGAGGKPKWFMELNPKGEVPVVVCSDGRVVADSERTLDAIAAHPGACLTMQQEDPDGLIQDWRDRVNQDLIPIGKRAVLAGDRESAFKLMRSLDSQVVGPYLAGDFSLADISIAPFLQRLESEFGIPDDCPRLKEVWGQLGKRPSIQRTIQSSWWWWW